MVQVFRVGAKKKRRKLSTLEKCVPPNEQLGPVDPVTQGRSGSPFQK